MTSPSCSRIAQKAAVHGLALVTLMVGMGLMHVAVRPIPRKFFCDDQSIRYPQGGCTVPYYVCAPVGVLVAWLAVAAAEWGPARAAARKSESRRLRSLLALARRLCSSDAKSRYLSLTLYGVYYFCLGLAACDFLMGAAKNVFGRHRPFFLAVCRPDLSGGGGCNSSVAYDVSVCRPAVPEREFLDAQRSFPSGHASFSVYCGAFVVLYLQRRGRGTGALLTDIPRLAVQFSAAAAGLYVAASRVFDYKHHWSDVLAGGLLGAGLAWAVAGAVPKLPAGGGGVDKEGEDDGDLPETERSSEIA